MDTCPPDVGSPWLCAVRVIRAAPAHCCVTLPRGVKLWHGHPGGVMAGGWCPDASGAGFEGWGWVVWPLANPKRGNKWGNKSSYEKVKPSIHAGFKASFSRRQPQDTATHWKPQSVAVFLCAPVSCGVPKFAPISHRNRTDHLDAPTRALIVSANTATCLAVTILSMMNAERLRRSPRP